MEKQTLGQKIAELRKAKNMTQLELANQLNITDKAVSKWERDISCPDINTFPKLAGERFRKRKQRKKRGSRSCAQSCSSRFGNRGCAPYNF